MWRVTRYAIAFAAGQIFQATVTELQRRAFADSVNKTINYLGGATQRWLFEGRDHYEQ